MTKTPKRKLHLLEKISIVLLLFGFLSLILLAIVTIKTQNIQYLSAGFMLLGFSPILFTIKGLITGSTNDKYNEVTLKDDKFYYWFILVFCFIVGLGSIGAGCYFLIAYKNFKMLY